MERGGRSAAAAAKTKNGKSGSKASARSGCAPPPGSAAVVPMDRVLASNAALRDHLKSLGATPPWYVTGKQLRASDVHGNQARLLFSCKSGGSGPAAPISHPLAACFTELEAARVADKGAGLLVTALDGRGRSHDLTCKYLGSNNAYRFIAGWKAFVEANGLGLRDGESDFSRHVLVELWAFRSLALHNRYVVVDDDEDGAQKKKKKVREETGDPDGALGLVLLHYENEDNSGVEHGGVDAGEEEEGSQGTVVEEEPMPAAAPPVTRQEDLGGAGADEQREAATRAMSKDEMVAKFGEKMAFAAIGMNMLRMGRWGRD